MYYLKNESLLSISSLWNPTVHGVWTICLESEFYKPLQLQKSNPQSSSYLSHNKVLDGTIQVFFFLVLHCQMADNGRIFPLHFLRQQFIAMSLQYFKQWNILYRRRAIKYFTERMLWGNLPYWFRSHKVLLLPGRIGYFSNVEDSICYLFALIAHLGLTTHISFLSHFTFKPRFICPTSCKTSLASLSFIQQLLRCYYLLGADTSSSTLSKLR